MKFHGTAPDGSLVEAEYDPGLADADMCTAENENPRFSATLRPLCTLRAGHPGPWHIAESDTAIVSVWGVTSGG